MVPKLMNMAKENEDWIPYFLAESREGSAEGQQFRDRLAEGETFATDFLGASVEECGAFQLEQQRRNKKMEADSMVLLDARSGQDETVLFGYYVRSGDADLLPKDKRGATWYTFRIPYTKVFAMRSAMPPYGDADETWGVYYHRKEELTDEHGVFDFDKAEELVCEGEGFVEGLGNQ